MDDRRNLYLRAAEGDEEAERAVASDARRRGMDDRRLGDTRDGLRAAFRAGDLAETARIALEVATVDPRDVVVCGPVYRCTRDEGRGRGLYTVPVNQTFEHAREWAEVWRRVSHAPLELRADAIEPVHLVVAWVAAALAAGVSVVSFPGLLHRSGWRCPIGQHTVALGPWVKVEIGWRGDVAFVEGRRWLHRAEAVQPEKWPQIPEIAEILPACGGTHE